MRGGLPTEGGSPAGGEPGRGSSTSVACSWRCAAPTIEVRPRPRVRRCRTGPEEEPDESPGRASPSRLPLTAGQPRYVRPLPADDGLLLTATGQLDPLRPAMGRRRSRPGVLQRGQPSRAFRRDFTSSPRALIDHLTAVYDVDVHKDPVHAGELLHGGPGGAAGGQGHAAAVPEQRPLTFVLTGYPGVI